MSVQKLKRTFLVCARPWSWPFSLLLVLVPAPSVFSKLQSDLETMNQKPLRGYATANSHFSIKFISLYLSLLESYKTIHRLNGLNCTGYFEYNLFLQQNKLFTKAKPFTKVRIIKHAWNSLSKEKKFPPFAS